MTVEIEYTMPSSRNVGRWQVSMAEQIEANRGFPLKDIERELRGDRLIVRVETTLPDTAVENMLSDIEDHLGAGSEHVETREV